nr:Tn3 family transposase [Pseudomonas sp.]
MCGAPGGGACNTGFEPLIRNDNQALRRDRLPWVSQNYLRDDSLSADNAILAAAQSQLELAASLGTTWFPTSSPSKRHHGARYPAR